MARPDRPANRGSAALTRCARGAPLAIRPPCPHSAAAMRVTCPTCNAGYEVPESRIGTGRKLRCARCKNDWWVAPPEPGPAAPVGESSFARAVVQAAAMPATSAGAATQEPTGPAPSPPLRTLPEADAAPAPPPIRADEPVSRPPAPPIAVAPDAPNRPAQAEPRSSGGLLLAWIASLMIFLGVPAALLLYRVEIMEAWAPAERLYDAIGLGPGR